MSFINFDVLRFWQNARYLLPRPSLITLCIKNSKNGETHLSDNAILLSTTDLKGNIQICESDFSQISEFSAAELQGNPHNIVRHQDMPAAAFKILWERIKQGKPWMGIVKNRTKNGGYYW